MPELPEAETIVRGLQKILPGKKISGVGIIRPKLIKRIKPSLFAKTLTGDTFSQITRRAKYILIGMKSGKTLVVHLGMSGAILKGHHSDLTAEIKKLAKTDPNKAAELLAETLKPRKGPWRFVRIVFFLGEDVLYYSDLRLFGKLWLVDSAKINELPELSKLGIEPLTKEFTFKKFKEIIKGKKTKIKILMMDQALIVGLGNIYINEALFRAGVMPTRPADSLSEEELKKVYKESIAVLEEGVKYRGTSNSDYYDLEGKEGQFQNHLKVYDRKGDACPKCGGVVQKMKLGQRGTYFCPKCQK
jgi:formamidopyrimidine-DNA glycosylase